MIPIHNYEYTSRKENSNASGLSQECFKSVGRSTERSTEQPSDRATERQSDRAIDRATERPIERPNDRPSDRAIDRAIDRATERSTERSGDLLMGWWGIAKRIEYIKCLKLSLIIGTAWSEIGWGPEPVWTETCPEMKPLEPNRMHSEDCDLYEKMLESQIWRTKFETNKNNTFLNDVDRNLLV